jgi:hypothetical protein
MLIIRSGSYITVCAIVGYLASYWNRLMLPERCRDSSFSSFATMIRSSGSWQLLGKVVQLIMDWYSWRHLAVLSDLNTSGYCYVASQPIVERLSTNSRPGYNYTVFLVAMKDSPSIQDIDGYLNVVSRGTRGNCTLLKTFLS